MGVLKEYQGKGIVTTFFENLEKWAKENSVIRLELTVECHNEAARKLYEKSDFKVEGIRAKSMLVKGEVVDEYYMAKIYKLPNKKIEIQEGAFYEPYFNHR